MNVSKSLIGSAILGMLLSGWMATDGVAQSDRTPFDKQPPAPELAGMSLVFHDDFESGDTANWSMSDPAVWRLGRQDENGLINQFEKKSSFNPEVRSPFHRALVKNVYVGDFVLDVQLQSTIPDYGHRDMCLFFGYQDDSHLYYVHFGKQADDHANQIFIVNGAPRKKISLTSTAGTDWDDNWHHARVVRNVESGEIKIYFDDMENPVMTAVDKTFTSGQVGIGTFDDTGNYDNVLVYANLAQVATTPVVLEGTKKLTLEKPLDEVMVAGIDEFALHEIAASSKRRDAAWNRDFSSPEAYAESVKSNRERFRTYIGAVDPREAEIDIEIVSSLKHDGTIAETEQYTVKNVRWRVLDGITAEGLLLEPKGTPLADVIAIPDADWTPEVFVGLVAGGDKSGFIPRRLVEQGIRVIVPTLISRDDTFSGSPYVRYTNQTHREFVYRMAFEMGRHVIGYEVQKVLAAVDALERLHAAKEQPLPIGVIGVGEGGLLALYSGALDSRIASVGVCGYFRQREGVWEEPIYRNVWALLTEFGDAELAGLIAPRTLTIEACAVPESAGPPAVKEGRSGGAAPGKIETAITASVRIEFDRAQPIYTALNAVDQLKFISSGEGDGNPGTDGALATFIRSLGIADGLKPAGTAPMLGMQPIDPVVRQQRQVAEMVEFTQDLLRVSSKVRDQLWSKASRASVDEWVTTSEAYRSLVYDEMIGRLPPTDTPMNPRTRKVFETDQYTGYEVVLDVYPHVIAGGILVLPKGMKAGEKRPVVVCQHGLEGTPMSTISDDPNGDWRYYKSFTIELAKRGFITYAPQNPYRGKDLFRTLQRKSNVMKRSLFSYIIPQHERTLEFLATLPNVDPARIGFYGLSYGGKTAVRVPPMVKQYALSICSADYNEWVKKNTSSEDGYSYIFTGEYEIFEWNMGHMANYAELSTLMTPRPFMVERGHDDGVAPDEWVAWEYSKVKRHYDKLGIGDKTEIEFFIGPHTINGVKTYEFLHRHLNWPVPSE